MSNKLTPLKAIRAKCLDCMAGQANEVKLCPSDDCPLYGFRMGHNPNRAGIAQLNKRFSHAAHLPGYLVG